MSDEISSSPQRNTFQTEAYIKRQAEKGIEVDPETDDYLAMYANFDAIKKAKQSEPEWQQDNMEYDLRTTEWILEKARSSEKYSQNLYAALCNNDFRKNEVVPILRGDHWSCSWRYAGGIIANMRESGDYIDWYCSGMGQGLGNGDEDGTRGYTPEGEVTDEIRDDLFKLGWLVVDEPKYD